MHGQQNIKLRKISCVHVDGIHLAPDEGQCYTLVNSTVNCRFRKRCEFLTKSVTEFSRRNLLGGVVERVGSPPLFVRHLVFIMTAVLLFFKNYSQLFRSNAEYYWLE
jgi:hypothetical protein